MWSAVAIFTSHPCHCFAMRPCSFNSHTGHTPPLHSFELLFNATSCAVYNTLCIIPTTSHFHAVDLFTTLHDISQPKFALGLQLCLVVVVGEIPQNIYGCVVQFCAVRLTKALLHLESDHNESYLILCNHADCMLPMRVWHCCFKLAKWLDLFELHPNEPQGCHPPAPALSFISMLASSKDDWAHPI